MFKKIIILSSIVTSSLFATISIENVGINEGFIDYQETAFNKKMNIKNGCLTIKEIFDDIYDQTGYTIANQTNLDLNKPVCSAYKFDKLGNLLDAVIMDMNVVYRAHHNTIILEYTKEYSAKFPMHWDVERTIVKLKDRFPNIKMYTFGQSIRITGSKKDVNKAEPILKRTRDWAHRKIPFNIIVSKINSKYSNDKVAIMSKIKKDGKINRIKSSHATSYPIHLDVGSVVFDLQKNRVILNNDKFINFNQLNSYSFLRNGYQVNITSPFGAHLF